MSYLRGRTENWYLSTWMHRFIITLFIMNGQKIETTQIFISGRIIKL